MITIWDVPILADVREIIDDLRRELKAQNVPLLKDVKGTYQNVMVTCIAHKNGQERTPSLGISTVETKRSNGRVDPAGTVHCFTCGYRANLPEFVSDCFGKGDKGMFGWKWISSRYANVEVQYRKPLELNMSRERETVEPINYVSEEELDSYRFIHPYMYERKLTDKVIEYFDVGYDKDNDCLTFPVHDKNGKVVLFQRRSCSPCSGNRFKNDSAVKKSDYLYGYYQVLKNLSWIKELYICESPIDALTCWTHRKPAVALMGSAVSSKQVQLLVDLPLRKYILATDNDDAGEKAANKIKKGLGRLKLLYRIQLPENRNDINDLTVEEFETLGMSLF